MTYAREYLPFMPEWTLYVLYPLTALALGALLLGLRARLGKYSGGGLRLLDEIRSRSVPRGPRYRRAVADALLQTKVRERGLPALLHLPIVYGMLLLLAGTTLVFIDEDILKNLGLPQLMRGRFYIAWELLLDVAGLALIVGVGVALFRRHLRRPAFLPPKRDTSIVLVALLFMGVSGFALEGYRLAAHPHPDGGIAFVGDLVSLAFGSFARESGGAAVFYRLLWWAHGGVALALIGGIAYTGLSHIFTIPAHVGMQDATRPRARLTTPFNLIEAMESEEDVDLTSGTSTVGDLPPLTRLAVDACVACGRCEAECPAYDAGRPLSPRQLVQDIQGAVREGSDPGAAEFEDPVWSCTNCYACEEACPARIRHVDVVLDFRRALVDANRLDEQKLGVLQALDRNQNPLRLPSHQRAAWLLEMEGAEEFLAGSSGSPPEWLYWLGCTAGFDDHAAASAMRTMELFKQAGVSFAVLGPAEACCGEPAKRLGEEGRFQMMAMTNMEMIRETGARAVVSHCPHCVSIIGHEYGGLGFDLPVVHHSELLLRLVEEGTLRRPDAVPGREHSSQVVVHESCNLARTGKGRPVLDVLRAAGLSTVLPARTGARTFCCGGGGANMWYSVEQETERISTRRLRELASLGPGGEMPLDIVTACPFCVSMLRDAAGSAGVGDVRVLELADALGGVFVSAGGQP